jgi:hypothetical protein
VMGSFKRSGPSSMLFSSIRERATPGWAQSPSADHPGIQGPSDSQRPLPCPASEAAS